MELIEAASAEFERVVRQLPSNAWDRPTPSDISVRELVEHVVVGNRFAAMVLAGVDRDEARACLAGDQLAGDLVAAAAESGRRQHEAFARACPARTASLPAGDVSAAAFLRFRLVDLVVHAWDLRRGALLDELLDPSLVADLSGAVQPHLSDMLAYGAYGAGPSGTLSRDAPPQDQLLDWIGRRP